MHITTPKDAPPLLPRRRQPLSSRLGKDLARNKYAYLMFLPVFAWYIIFQYLPMTNIVIAFQNYNIFKGISGSEWVGFDNFISFFNLRTFWRLIRNTLMLSLYGLVLDFPAPILLALMINEVTHRRARKVMQTISYIPHFISMIVVCGMIRAFCSSTGLFNSIRLLFGAPDTYNLLSNPGLYRIIHVGSSVWQGCGWSSIIYLATLSNIDPTLYEAAYLDGASRVQRIVHVTLPGLVPLMTIQFIMRLGHILSVGYEKVILLYNPSIYETADIISTYVYRYGLLDGKYSMGAAVGLFNSVISLIILVSVNAFFRRFTEESLW